MFLTNKYFNESDKSWINCNVIKAQAHVTHDSDFLKV